MLSMKITVCIGSSCHIKGSRQVVERIKELVASETENKREDLPPSETWRIRKEESLATLEKTDDLGVLMVVKQAASLTDRTQFMSMYEEWCGVYCIKPQIVTFSKYVDEFIEIVNETNNKL